MTTAEQTTAFNPNDYADPRLRLDQVDGKEVTGIRVKFSGTITLDRKNPAHVALYRRLALGKELSADELPLGLRVAGRHNLQKVDEDGYVTDLLQTCVLQVTDLAGGFDPRPGDDTYGDPGQE